ncbi:hypothetical protein [Cyanobium sp. Morenito 9A2]|uniref:hypothetical protein n=1 Tax=Cyanobium sp. Morenito 9A2 TaxID=2823718 RepID=UPI0020CFD483|nr:hypothetical protein [Cyanobium sp. Morenito 9A2]MCP9848420.1 hypothetical protein [Cyanobium sp. Morenito 9A2]
MVLVPVVVVLMICSIASGQLHMLSPFTALVSCLEPPLAAQAREFIQPGVGLLVIAPARRWLLGRKAQ